MSFGRSVQEIDISEVTSIEVNIECQLIIIQGNNPNIEVVGDAVDMKTVRTLVLDDFGISISGVGNIEMQLESKWLKLNCSGVGNIDLTGKTDDMHISVSGVGNISATDFIAANARVSNSGVGRVNVHVEEDLNAKVLGIGSISYAGKPSVQSNVYGLGRISRY